MSIKIDKEFESLIPPLSPEEFQQLEENCIKDGIRDPLVVWPQDDGNSILIDGHNRFKIAAKHAGIRFEVKSMTFEKREDAIRWIILNQFGRRNLSAYDRSVLALKLKPVVAKMAKERQAQAGRGEEVQKSAQAKTRDELAKAAGVSHDTIRKVEAIQNSGNQQLIDDVREGRESINSGYQRVNPKKTPAQSSKEETPVQDGKTVSIHEDQLDKANKQIIALNLHARLLNMGKRINDVSIDIDQGTIDLTEMCKALDKDRIKSLKTSIRVMYEQLMKIDKEIRVQ